MMTSKRRPGQRFEPVTNMPVVRTADQFNAAITSEPASSFGGFRPNSGSDKTTLRRSSKWSRKVWQDLDLR